MYLAQKPDIYGIYRFICSSRDRLGFYAEIQNTVLLGTVYTVHMYVHVMFSCHSWVAIYSHKRFWRPTKITGISVAYFSNNIFFKGNFFKYSLYSCNMYCTVATSYKLCHVPVVLANGFWNIRTGYRSVPSQETDLVRYGDFWHYVYL